jgi:DNA-binding Lrp family transcriptional regulator
LAVVIDELDKQILSHMCRGIFSYEDLAKTLNVTRGTIYRRIARLEKNKIIESKIMAVPNYSKLELSAIFLGVNIDFDGVEDLIKILRDVPNVKGLWRSYGDYQIIAQLICGKGCEGDAISNFHKVVARSSKRINQISIGFDWRKFDISPY